MSARTRGIVGGALIFACGCVGPSGMSPPTPGTVSADGFRERLSSIVESVQKPFKELAGSRAPAHELTWDWVTAVPTGTARAETILPTLAHTSVRALLPDFRGPDVQ